MKERHVDSLQGWVGMSRMRYYCRKCRQGFYPLDRRLKLSDVSRMSQQKEKQMALLSVRLPYEEARKVYGELTGHSAGRMTAHRTVQRLGKALIKNKKAMPLQRAAKDSTHITGDGAMIHFRNEGWKEVKVGGCYKVDKKRRAREIVYTATVKSREQFGEQLYAVGGSPDISAASSRQAFIGDGAEWLTEIQKLHFPESTRIVDFWHVTEYLWNVASSFYGQGTIRGRKWAESKVKLLMRGRWKAILKSLAYLHPKNQEQQETLKKTKTYFQNQGIYMNYPRYKKLGFHIGSGVSEGACKHVLQARFKQAGMRWSQEGAENLLQLRVSYLNQGSLSIPDCALN